MVDKSDTQMSIRKQCDMLQLHRSGVYYTLNLPSNADDEIMKQIDRFHLMDPTLGTRRMKAMLVRMGYNIGRKHVRTLMNTMRIHAVYCKPRTTIADPAKYKYPYLLKELKITKPNQVWGIDITYIPMRRGFMYMVAIIDHYSRFIVGWSLSNSMSAPWVVETVREAIRKHGKPEIINSDQGSQFTSDDYVNFIKSCEGTKISMDGKGRYLDNIYIERFWRSIKHDKIYLMMPQNGTELFNVCEEFVEYYNKTRPHETLGYISPSELFKIAA